MWTWGAQQNTQRGTAPKTRGNNHRRSLPAQGRLSRDEESGVFETQKLRAASVSVELNSHPTAADERQSRMRYIKGRGAANGSRRISAQGPVMGNSQVQAQQRRKSSIDPTLDFPILNDNKTKNFIRSSKVMVILRGLPGSGKSYLTQILLDTYNRGCVVCSADHFFNQGGLYRFNGDKLRDAHNQCQQRTTQAATNGKHLIVVDNTNVQQWELDFYLKCAEKHDYIVLFMEPKTSWKTDVAVLSKVTQHPIEEDKLLQRKRQWEYIVPLYYGWFLNYGDSLTLLKTALAYFEECKAISGFSQQIREQLSFSGDRDMEGYYNLDTAKSLKITAAYFGNKSKSDFRQYQSLEAVRKAYGEATLIKVIGFFLTPYTVGARVALTPTQLQVWANDDEERPPPVQIGLDVMRNSAKPQPRRNQINQTTCIPTLKSQPNPTAKSKNRFYPTDGVGRRAHITIGHAAGVEAVQTGFDLLQAIDFEREAKRGGKSVSTFNLSGAVVRKYGEDNWVVYPDQMFTMDAMFAYYAIRNEMGSGH